MLWKQGVPKASMAPDLICLQACPEWAKPGTWSRSSQILEFTEVLPPWTSGEEDIHEWFPQGF